VTGGDGERRLSVGVVEAAPSDDLVGPDEGKWRRRSHWVRGGSVKSAIVRAASLETRVVA
jgi:hypothetical protein